MAEFTTVRCRSASCLRPFEISSQLLGRNVYCLHCGERMTARPATIDAQLEERERATAGQQVTPVDPVPLRVIVDNVRSLWNVGSIFRTADACGVEELILSGITGCPPRMEISKTALGAEQSVSWRYVADPADALVPLVQGGYTAVVLETGDEAVPVDELCWPERVCLVIGNEVAGVGQQLLRQPCHRVSIPMYGTKESLNVAVAFGIAAHAATRALRRPPP